jgi:ribonucleotide monophosphatase NagD (HAD superfamily)
VVIAGDLAHWGEVAAYKELKKRVSGFKPPVVIMIGNDDDRAAFCTVSPEAMNDGNGVKQGSRIINGHGLVFLDTKQQGTRDEPTIADLCGGAESACHERQVRYRSDRPDRAFSYDTIRITANAVLAGAALVICNPDRMPPGPGSSVVPETGALAAAIVAYTGPIPYRVVGKLDTGPRLSK